MPAPVLIPWDTNNVNILEPDAGHQAKGWAPNEKPTSTNFNWLIQNIMQWIAFLSPAGTFAVENFAVGSTTWNFAHNLNRAHVTIVIDAANGVGNQVGPNNIVYGLNTDVITFGGNQTGSAVAR